MGTKGGALIGGVFGALVGSGVVAQQIYANYKPERDFYPHRHEYRVDGVEEPKGDLEFTYYYDGYTGAFNRVGLKQVKELRKKGYVVRVREIHEWLKRFNHPKAKPLNDFAVVHPLFFTAPASLGYLAKRHRYILGFEVADTTQIGENWVHWANSKELDALFVPSKFAFETFTRSGVQNRVTVLPHGVSKDFQKASSELEVHNRKLEAIRRDPRPKILFFCLHSGKSRKGSQFLHKALRRLKAKGREFVLVVKTFPKGNVAWYDASSEFSGVPVIQVDDWISEEELLYLYDSCDLLVHPYRGGAFELNPFEALARGLPVVVTGWGCVLEYCDFHTAYLIAPKGYTRVFPLKMNRSVGHRGFGVDPDVDHLRRLIEFVLDNPEHCKKKAMKNRKFYTKRTWSRVVDQFLKEVEEIWETH